MAPDRTVARRYWKRQWTPRPLHIRAMTEADKQQVFVLAHTLPEDVYGPVGFHPNCQVCNSTRSKAVLSGSDQQAVSDGP